MAAKQRVVVEGSSSVTASQLSELFRQIGDRSINGINLQRFLDHQNPFELDAVDIDWSRVYKTLGMKFEPGDLAIDPDPNFWDVYVLKGVTANRVVEVLRGFGVDVSLYVDDLDGDVNNLKRDPKNGSYRVRFKKTVEADPDLAEKSADDLDAEGIDGIALVERLLLELGYFLATGNHLDVENATLCSGSRYLGGVVPSVGWRADDRGLYVGWDHHGSRDSELRARAAVSLPVRQAD